jgi:exopolyphosphatase/pppGpp-phosphohydrolase
MRRRTFGRPGSIEEQFSVDVGAVRVTERYDLAGTVADDALRAALGSIATDLARLHGRTRPDTLIGMGGTATNLASVQHGIPTYDAEVVHGTVLTLAEPERPAARLALLTAFAPERVDDGTIADCRRAGADDAALVATSAWASFATARRIAAWSARAAERPLDAVS